MNTKKPNVILVTADQLRADALGCYGNPIVRTPNIDALAMEGTLFDNHIIQHPVCMPSRASIITGKYPRNHGTTDNGIPLRQREITIPQVLKENGYLTAAVGKMHFSNMLGLKGSEDESWPPGNYGFTIKHLTCDRKIGEYLEDLKIKNPEAYRIVKEQGEKKLMEDTASASAKVQSKLPQVFESELDYKDHQSTWITDKTIEVIEKSENNPFFIWCSFVDPHHPFDPPKPYNTLYQPENMPLPLKRPGELDDKPVHFRKHLKGKGYGNEKYDFDKIDDLGWQTITAKYYGMVSLIDYNVGRIIDKLKQLNILEDTIIIFSADHGELLGDHGLLFKGPFHYDCLIKAPLIIRLGDQIPHGARCNEITQHVDLMPSILEFTGSPTPPCVQGRSLGPLLRGDRGAGYEYALVEHNCYDWGLKIKTIRGKRWKLTYYAGEEFGELYDLNADPEEFFNLWDNPEYREIRMELSKKLLDRLIDTEGTDVRIKKF